mmetsp:Transcript_2856/g.9696  ORF Transcript_2856/g.9696 Transcript_2856/m.9696 type:complete len:304 (-) Transcript_2856:150-1061(-)
MHGGEDLGHCVQEPAARGEVLDVDRGLEPPGLHKLCPSGCIIKAAYPQAPTLVRAGLGGRLQHRHRRVVVLANNGADGRLRDKQGCHQRLESWVLITEGVHILVEAAGDIICGALLQGKHRLKEHMLLLWACLLHPRLEPPEAVLAAAVVEHHTHDSLRPDMSRRAAELDPYLEGRHVVGEGKARRSWLAHPHGDPSVLDASEVDGVSKHAEHPHAAREGKTHRFHVPLPREVVRAVLLGAYGYECCYHDHRERVLGDDGIIQKTPHRAEQAVGCRVVEEHGRGVQRPAHYWHRVEAPRARST